jgi:hypothetical protein
MLDRALELTENAADWKEWVMKTYVDDMERA